MNTTHNKRGDKQTYRDVTPEELGATSSIPQRDRCESIGIHFKATSTAPAQLQCKNCHQFWFLDEQTPVCKPVEINTIFEPSPQGWEKEFEALIDNPNEELGMKLSQNDEDVIKSFIRSVESRAREEVVKFLEKHGQYHEDRGAIGGKSFTITATFMEELKSINKESGGK